jgi:hypothetical protein
MRVRFRNPKREDVPREEAVYISPSQIFLTAGRDYEVHAVSVYDRLVFVLVVDDKETPIFLPRTIFDVSDPGVPGDWICNVFPEGPVQLVLGPPFIAKDLDSYNAMIDQRMEQVTQFWKRVESLSQGET